MKSWCRLTCPHKIHQFLVGKSPSFADSIRFYSCDPTPLQRRPPLQWQSVSPTLAKTITAMEVVHIQKKKHNTWRRHPQNHPFLDGIFHEINQPLLGTTIYGNLHIIKSYKIILCQGPLFQTPRG